MTNRLEMNRRQFVVSTAAVGGGMALGVRAAGAQTAATGADIEINAWVLIAADGTVSVRVGKTEIGNGAVSTLPMMVCEELGCDWNKIKVLAAEPNWDMKNNNVFAGKIGARNFNSNRSYQSLEQFQQAGASVRERLKAAAAKNWNVGVADLTVNNGEVIHTASGRKAPFGQLAAQAAQIKLDKEPAVKAPDQWTFLGKARAPRTDVKGKVDGSAVFGLDVKAPNMLYAALRQSPVMGGKLKSYDFSAIKDRPGVHSVVVVDPSEARPKTDLKTLYAEPAPQSAVAVIADSFWHAKSALDVMPVQWDDGPGANTNSEDFFKTAIAAVNRGGGTVNRKEGDPLAVIAKGGKLVEATYQAPFLEHALMEPLNGTALVNANNIEMWISTQASQNVMLLAAIETGVPLNNVVVHAATAGGAFGRRIFGDDARMVVAVAKKVPGRPVKVIWSREETTRQGRFNPFSVAKLQAVLGADGLPEAMVIRIAGHTPSTGVLIDTPYASAIPNFMVESIPTNTHLLTGPWRGPGYNTNVFFLESFVDELAHAAGKDPMDYRRSLFAKWSDPAWLKVLNEAANKGEWGKKNLPKGTAQGFAIGAWPNSKPNDASIIANLVQVTVGTEGSVKVDTVDIAFDTGKVLHPDGITAQFEGGTIMGVNKTLNEELTVRNGRVVQGNFDDYPMVRIADTPTIKVHFGGLTGGAKLTEAGEPPIAPPAPAIANAVFRATGKRIRALPFRNHDLSWS